MNETSFVLRRLRVLSGGTAVYDQAFREGVNIIAGENGSGKSTIADFIFYVLGGEFDDWKAAARRCDEVQAELKTKNGVLTLRRLIEGKQTPILTFFGPMAAAQESALDSWQRLPIRRQSSVDSFSQIIFRASGLPEAQSEGASNITMHQILRLLYSDQRTPASRLFRFELFDTKSIREAVGDLLCGSDSYDGYALQLEIRALQQSYEEAASELKAALSILPTDSSFATTPGIETAFSNLRSEAASVSREIDDVDELVGKDTTTTYMKDRRIFLKSIEKTKSKVAALETALSKMELEIEELGSFKVYLEDLDRKLTNTEKSAHLIGNVEFIHCPSCLTRLNPPLPGICAVCGSSVDPEEQQSKYLQIRLDIQAQLRESSQLEEARASEKSRLSEELRHEQAEYRRQLTEFSARYNQSNSPREAFLAQRFRRIGQIEESMTRLEELMEVANKIQNLTNRKNELDDRIRKLRDSVSNLQMMKEHRMRTALGLISSIARDILASDLPRQDEFQRANDVRLVFGDDAILVDGAVNFAESSNVILKNTAILAFMAAACKDEKFLHPRFLLMDNVEDKGMEQQRSHNFQKLIVEQSERAGSGHQIIFTTSMINPSLANETLLVGPIYTKTRRTLMWKEEQRS